MTSKDTIQTAVERSSTHSAQGTAGEVLGVRALSKQRTRDEIIRAGLHLFGQHGYDAVSTQEIAAEAGVTQRTLFRYFPHKSDILFSGDFDYVVSFEHHLDEAMRHEPDPMDAISTAFRKLIEMHDANRGDIAMVYNIVHASDDLMAVDRSQQHRLDTLVAFALDGAKAYAVRHKANAVPSLSSRILAAIIFSATLPPYRAWLRGELQGPLMPYAQFSWDKLLPMLQSARQYADDIVSGCAAIDHASP